MNAAGGTPTISLSVNLAALHGRLTSQVQRIAHFVSWSLSHAAEVSTLSPELRGRSATYSLPELSWTPDQATLEYRQWTLLSGFRDLVEATGLFLEDVREIAGTWKLFELQKDTGYIKGSDWNREIVNRRRRFHQLGLPVKIEVLQEDYGLILGQDVKDQALSLNRARNCLAHRAGIVGDADVDDNGVLTISWRRLALILMRGDEEIEVIPPYDVEAGASIGMRWQLERKCFDKGMRLDLNDSEFAEIAWAVSIFGMAVASSLEARGRSIGVAFPSISPSAV